MCVCVCVCVYIVFQVCEPLGMVLRYELLFCGLCFASSSSLIMYKPLIDILP